MARLVQDTGAQGLGAEQHIAGGRVLVVDDLVGLGDAEGGQAVLGFGVIDGMAAHDEGAGFDDLIGSALHDVAD